MTLILVSPIRCVFRDLKGTKQSWEQNTKWSSSSNSSSCSTQLATKKKRKEKKQIKLIDTLISFRTCIEKKNLSLFWLPWASERASNKRKKKFWSLMKSQKLKRFFFFKINWNWFNAPHSRKKKLIWIYRASILFKSIAFPEPWIEI